MKKLFIRLLLLAGIVLTSEITAQSFRMGTVVADAGFGFGIYGIKSYSPVNNQEHDGIAFIGTLPSIDAEFGLFRFLGVGAHYRRGTYGKTSGGKIRGSDFALMVNFHIANKGDKFDLPIGVGYGLSNMKADLSTTEHLYAKGGLFRVQIAPHFYFGKHIGMFVRIGYNKHLFNSIELQDGVGKTYTEADGATWTMGGPEFNLGVTFKIDALKKKEDK